MRKHKIARAFTGPIDLPHLNDGDIVLGTDFKGREVRLPVQAFNDHCLTISGSGGGKTFKSRFLALQIAPRVRGMWLIDLRKQEFRCLVPLLARIGIELIVVPGRILRWNPLQLPRYVEPEDYAPRIADLLVQVLRLPGRAAKLLHTTILELYEQSGVMDGGDRFPTMFELRERVANDRETNAQARQALVDALDPVLISLRSVLSYRQGWTTGDLAGHHVAFEFAGLSETDKDLLVATLLLSEFTSRIAQGASNVPMDLWINADEAARMVSARGTAVGLTAHVRMAATSRRSWFISSRSVSLSSFVRSIRCASSFSRRCDSSSWLLMSSSVESNSRFLGFSRSIAR